MTGRIRSTWAREAISGTTPPNRSCRCSCEATTDDEHFELVGDDRRRRFVAGGFEDQKSSSSGSVQALRSKLTGHCGRLSTPRSAGRNVASQPRRRPAIGRHARYWARASSCVR